MSQTQKTHPDRYSAIIVRDEDELPGLIKAARKLGMTWLVQSQTGRFDSDRTYFYLFFDEEGKQAYLSGAWQEQQ